MKAGPARPLGAVALLALLLAGAARAQEAGPPPEAPPEAPAGAPPDAPPDPMPAPASAAPAAGAAVTGAPPGVPPPARRAAAPAAPAAGRPATAPAPAPVAREAVIAVLDKRRLRVVDLVVKPDQPFATGRLSGVMQVCTQSPPGRVKETAAFLDLAVTPSPREGEPAPRPKRIFSGWMFLDSPSLNPVADPVYDVWVRSCTIIVPESAAPARASAPARPPRASTASSAPQAASTGNASVSSER